MTNKTNIGLAEFALKMLGQPYWWGTCAYPATKSLLDRKTIQYPTAYTPDRMNRYKADIAKGAIVADCIGIVKGFYWLRDDGKQIYGLDGRPDKGANGMFEAAKVKGPIATLPEVPGLLLYHKDHAGVYIGNGWAVEAQSFSKGIVMTEVAKRRWTHWYQCRYIDYIEGAVSPDVPERPTQPPVAPTPPTLPTPPAGDPPTPPVPPADGTPGQPDGDALPDYGTRLLKYVKGRRLLSGDDVLTVQTRLAQLGYEPGKIDGLYGALSDAAVRAFQGDAGIAVDGMVGSDTRAALSK